MADQLEWLIHQPSWFLSQAEVDDLKIYKIYFSCLKRQKLEEGVSVK